MAKAKLWTKVGSTRKPYVCECCDESIPAGSLVWWRRGHTGQKYYIHDHCPEKGQKETAK